MGLWTSGKKGGLGGGSRAAWFKGEGEVLVKLTSAVTSTNRKKNDQTILTMQVLARAPDSDPHLGEEYAYRFCLGEARYPESDSAEFARFVAGFHGVRIDAQENTLTDLGLDPETYDLESERGRTLADLDIDERFEGLVDEMTSGEGDVWADKVCSLRLITPKGYTKLYASAIPSGMHDAGTLTDKGLAILQNQDWEVVTPF